MADGVQQKNFLGFFSCQRLLPKFSNLNTEAQAAPIQMCFLSLSMDLQKHSWGGPQKVSLSIRLLVWFSP